MEHHFIYRDIMVYTMHSQVVRSVDAIGVFGKDICVMLVKIDLFPCCNDRNRIMRFNAGICLFYCEI